MFVVFVDLFEVVNCCSLFFRLVVMIVGLLLEFNVLVNVLRIFVLFWGMLGFFRIWRFMFGIVV